MANPAGESSEDVLRLDFDRRLILPFRGSVVTSDAGLLAYCELDYALGLCAMLGEKPADARTGKNGRYTLVGMLQKSVFGRFAGYEDVNDAERLLRLGTSRLIASFSRQISEDAAEPHASSAVHRPRFDEIRRGLYRPASLAQPRCPPCTSDTTAQSKHPEDMSNDYCHSGRAGGTLNWLAYGAMHTESLIIKWPAPSRKQSTLIKTLSPSSMRFEPMKHSDAIRDC